MGCERLKRVSIITPSNYSINLNSKIRAKVGTVENLVEESLVNNWIGVLNQFLSINDAQHKVFRQTKKEK